MLGGIIKVRRDQMKNHLGAETARMPIMADLHYWCYLSMITVISVIFTFWHTSYFIKIFVKFKYNLCKEFDVFDLIHRLCTAWVVSMKLFKQFLPVAEFHEPATW